MKRSTRGLFLLLLTALLGTGLNPARANGLIVVDEPVHIRMIPSHPPVQPPIPPRPPILPPRPPRPIHRHLPLDLESQQVEIEIRSQVAVTEVTQVFHNSSSRRLEGTFIFPIPAGAHVSDFSMDINGEQVEAELLDADKARKIYEDIVRRAQDPALFEYAGQSMFKVRIFPIEPRSKKEVRVRYTELLERDGGIVRYIYPLSAAKYTRKTIPEFSMRVRMESGEGRVWKTIYSPSHEVEINRKKSGRAVLGLEEEDLKVEEDFQLYFSEKAKGGGPVDLDFLTHRGGKAGEGSHFLLLLSPAAWTEELEPMEKDVVFVFDSSGSMRGEKMAQAQAALRYCIDGLNPGDRFEVIRFSTEAEPVFEELREATKENRKKALSFVDSVKAIGGTAIEESLALAMRTAAERAEEGRPVQVIFLTDGKPTLGATQEDVILRTMRKARGDGEEKIRVFCFGIGTQINTHLLDRITEETKAVSKYVLPDEDLEEKVSRFYAKISDPVLTDLRLDWEGMKWVRERYPKDLPDLFRGEQLVVLGRFEGKGPKGRLILEGSLGEEERRDVMQISLGDGEGRNEFIAKLWATRRVGYLLDQIRLNGESGELKEEIVELARRYGIVTPYTTFLIVEDEERRNVPAPLRTQTRGWSGEDEIHGGVSIDVEFDAFQKDKDGGSAVAGAASTKQLKEAVRSSADRVANEVGDRARGARIGLVNSRRVAGKTFYQREQQWVDEEAQTIAKAGPDRQIKFGSDEYFALLGGAPQLAQWLSVGPEMQVVVGGELIEIIK